ncbi:hypothetical protein ACJX0J_016099, partial [Zea mays]
AKETGHDWFSTEDKKGNHLDHTIYTPSAHTLFVHLKIQIENIDTILESEWFDSLQFDHLLKLTFILTNLSCYSEILDWYGLMANSFAYLGSQPFSISIFVFYNIEVQSLVYFFKHKNIINRIFKTMLVVFILEDILYDEKKACHIDTKNHHMKVNMYMLHFHLMNFVTPKTKHIERGWFQISERMLPQRSLMGAEVNGSGSGKHIFDINLSENESIFISLVLQIYICTYGISWLQIYITYYICLHKIIMKC